MYPQHTTASMTHPVEQIQWSAVSIGKKLGEGSFADVFLGQWQGTEVALKHLKVGQLPEDVHASFLKEASIHANCASPRIVRLLGISNAPGEYALVLEYLPKGALYDVLHNSAVQLPWPTRWQIALDIATGLAYLHGKNIFHRDLKSKNILLDEQFRAKLGDFGQAQVKTHTQTINTGDNASGTLRWRAPETFKRRYRYESSAEVYSYGVVLWELASRALPYASETNDAVVMGYIINGDTEDIPSNTPPAFAQQIRESWDSNPSLRPEANKMKEALAEMKPQPVKKPWHFDASFRAQGTQRDGFELFDAGQSDIDTVLSAYNRHAVPNHEIVKIEVIHNPRFETQFAERVHALNTRAGNGAYQP